MFVYREEYYLGRSVPDADTEAHENWLAKMEQVHNVAEIIIGKQRHGPVGTVRLQFEGETTRFSDLDMADYLPDATI
jgi:replicative DNA helicase